MKTVKEFKNNGGKSVGVYLLNGVYTAMTFCESKSFKTEKGALSWLSKKGYK